MSYDPIDINCEDIQKEINSLKDSALPNYMTIIPIYFLTLNYETPECLLK